MTMRTWRKALACQGIDSLLSAMWPGRWCGHSALIAIKTAQFLPWVERESGSSRQHIQKLMSIAEMPITQIARDARFTLNVDELAAAGREVKRGALKEAVETVSILSFFDCCQPCAGFIVLTLK